MLINQSNLYKRQLQSAGDTYGYPLDTVTIADAGPVVSKTLTTVLLGSPLPGLLVSESPTMSTLSLPTELI